MVLRSLLLFITWLKIGDAKRAFDNINGMDVVEKDQSADSTEEGTAVNGAGTPLEPSL